MSVLSALASRVLPAGVLSRLDFSALLAQQGRMLKIETALPTLALIPEKMVMNDAVNAPFELVIDCLSTSAGFELKQLVGEQVSVSLLQATGSYKPWHGYVFEAAQLGSDGGLARYQLHMKPWIAFLDLRVDSFIFQDKTTQAIVEDVFKDYDQANFRWDVSQELRTRSLCSQYNESDLAFVSRLLAEEGLSYRFEHLETDDASDADQAAQARHVMVIEDTAATRPDLGDVRFTGTHATANLDGQKDAVNSFAASRVVAANAVTLGAWNYKNVAGTAASDQSSLDIGDTPRLEIYDGSGGYRYRNGEAVAQATSFALGAIELGFKRFEGDGSARIFVAGQTFSLVDHPLYGANTSAFNYAGAMTASHARPDNQFCLLGIEHHATNNLGAQAANLLGLTELEQGTYVNHFHAVPAAAPVLPHFVRKPTAPGASTALVVGLNGEPITTDREHRVKVQFHWQRGGQPNAGGLAHASSADGTGNAPGNEQSGTWVRVALPAAGANWGASFTPRVGSEVAIGFVEGDIDRPLITGQLYNGVDTPPFSAGIDSGVNHPGVISGVHTQRLDQGGYNQWILDDASGQLRMRLLADYSVAELGLGYLIQQSGSSAQRGRWRGTGFEANTQGWVAVHAAKGLLISSSARAGTYGSAESTQMDAAEAIAHLKSASELGLALSDAAKSAGAQSLTAVADGKSLSKLIDSLDPTKDGKHTADVGGQSVMKANGRDAGSDPVEAFAIPVVVLDTPSAFAMATEAGIAAFAGEDLSMFAQGDVHHTAAKTWAAVSGKTSSWFTHVGGVKAFAANGPVSLRAHADALQIWADKEVTVISVNDEITVSASTKIEFIAGQSSMTLDGANIEFKTPGAFTVKGAMKAFLGGASGSAPPVKLPQGDIAPTTIELERLYHDDGPVAGADYTLTFADGSTRSGKLDGSGKATVTGVPMGIAEVTYGPAAAAYKPVPQEQMPGYDPAPSASTLDALVEKYAPGNE